jgi:hypothetical protein
MPTNRCLYTEQDNNNNMARHAEFPENKQLFVSGWLNPSHGAAVIRQFVHSTEVNLFNVFQPAVRFWNARWNIVEHSAAFDSAGHLPVSLISRSRVATTGPGHKTARIEVVYTNRPYTYIIRLRPLDG